MTVGAVQAQPPATPDRPGTGRVPASTYRLQITADFTLDDAGAQLDYLADLGVGWVYLSPVLQAEPGSAHGYDVIDHARVDGARGGPDALAAVLRRGARPRARRAGRHRAEPRRRGHPGAVGVVVGPACARPHSRYADAFDVDWAAGGGKILLPVLGSPDDLAELARRRRRAGLLRPPFPARPGHRPAARPQDVHDRQHYRLMRLAARRRAS